MTETSLKAQALELGRHPGQCLEHAPLEALADRLIALVAGASLALILASALIPAFASPASNWTVLPPRPVGRAAPIVNWHHVPPKRGDAPPPARDEVQQLYRYLMEVTAPENLRDLDGKPLALPTHPDVTAGGQ